MKIWHLTILLSLLFSCQKQAKNNQTAEASEPELSIPDNEPIQAEGIVYFSTDYSQSWANHSTGIAKEAFLTDIASTENELAIATKQHGIYQYDFASKQWHLIPSQPTTSRDIDALLLVGKNMLAGTQGDGIYKKEIGLNWVKWSNGLPANIPITEMRMLNNGILVAASSAWSRGS